MGSPDFLETDTDNNDAKDTLGGRIISARETQNLTTSQLARRLGVTTETLSDWENDRAAPRANRLMMLAGLVNVSPSWLLTGAGERPGEALSATEMMRIREQVNRIRELALSLADELNTLDERLNSYQSYQK